MDQYILISLILICTGNINPLNFETRDQQTGLTFVKLAKSRISYDTYTILYHIDITQYKNLTIIVENFLNEAEQQAWKLKTTTMKTVLNKTRVLLNYMRRDEVDIEAYQQKPMNRQKRAIEFVGDILHWAFGVMNAETAREYDERITQLAEDNNRIHNLEEEQTILIRESLAITNKTADILNGQMKRLQDYVSRYVDNTHDHLNWVQGELSFTEAVLFIKILETEHNRITQQILKCLEDVVTGKITQLIPKENLVKDLFFIEKLLREDQKLPIDFAIEDPLHIFKYSKIVSTLYGDRILMEVVIPIIEREKYTAYEIIPIPTTINDHTVIIKPTTKYILINDNGKDYIPITSSEYLLGETNLCGEKIIKPAENAHLDFTENCEISIFMHPNKKTIEKLCTFKLIQTTNYFISINSHEIYFVHVVKPITVMEYCRHRPAKVHEIKTNGLLKLEKDCRIITNKISLRPRTNYNYSSKDIITLSNHTLNTNLTSFFKIRKIMKQDIPPIEGNMLIQDHSVEFNNLIDKADKLIQKNNRDRRWNEVKNYHETNIANAIYFTLSMFLTIILVIIIIMIYAYYKFFDLSTWIQLRNTLNKKNPAVITEIILQSTAQDTDYYHQNSEMSCLREDTNS